MSRAGLGVGETRRLVGRRKQWVGEWCGRMRCVGRGREGEALASARGRVRSRALQRRVGGDSSSSGGGGGGSCGTVVVFLLVWRRRRRRCWACDLDCCFAKVAGLIFRAKKARAHDSTPSFSCSAGRSSGG